MIHPLPSSTVPNSRIVTGIQPSGTLTLGNYLGAIKNWGNQIASGNYGSVFCFLADLHALTVPHDAGQVQERNHHVTAAYLACGLDPHQITIFPQSLVPEHSQLMWLLATVTQMGKLDRMTQFKDKAGKNAERASLGLYAYPVLMAADILLYHATHVPVGEDQTQHLELTREIARTFNDRYACNFFPEPQTVLKRETMRIMSLRDGTKKMSKSDESDYSRINLTDDADLIVKKIQKAKTDPLPVPATIDEMAARPPEIANLVAIYAALDDTGLNTPAAVLNHFGGKSFADFKKSLADVAVAHLAPITEQMRRLTSAPDHLDTVLRNGAAYARTVAGPILQDTQKIMGFK
jgi:tryptophanyl-tRNA synthetase